MAILLATSLELVSLCEQFSPADIDADACVNGAILDMSLAGICDAMELQHVCSFSIEGTFDEVHGIRAVASNCCFDSEKAVFVGIGEWSAEFGIQHTVLGNHLKMSEREHEELLWNPMYINQNVCRNNYVNCSWRV